MNMQKDWRDSRNFIHLEKNPTIEATENAPLFTGVNIVLLYEAGDLSYAHCIMFLNSIESLYRQGKWYTTPISTQVRFSNDNFMGVIAGLEIIIKHGSEFGLYDLIVDAKKLRKKVPLFHKQLDHPRDFILVGYRKYPYIFLPILWISSLAFIISCFQTFKVRDGNKIIKTDRKIIAWAICKAFNMRLTLWVCDWLVRKKRRPAPSPGGFNLEWMFGRWSNVFKYYYKNQEHPNNLAILKIERQED